MPTRRWLGGLTAACLAAGCSQSGEQVRPAAAARPAATPIAATAATPIAATAAAAQNPYAGLAKAAGSDGRVELWLDNRINDKTLPSLQGLYWYGSTDLAAQQIVSRRPLAAAMLRVDGKDDVLDTPFARLERADLGGDAYVLRIAYGGFGQFNGEIGRPLALRGGALAPMAAVDALSGGVEEIQLRRAARTDWRIVSGHRNRGQAILQVICRIEDADDDGFREVFQTYAIESGQWTRRERLGRGYCAWGKNFPAAESFP